MSKENRYKEIHEMLAGLSDEEMLFVLWDSLQVYREYALKQSINNPKTIQEYASNCMISNHLQTIEQMRECLTYEIF